MKIAWSMIVLATCLTSCASKNDISRLQKEITDLKNHQAAEDKAKRDRLSQLEASIEAAETSRLTCRAGAEKSYDDGLAANGRPVRGRPGFYNGDSRVFARLEEDEKEGYADCQREYEDAMQEAKLKFGD